MSVVIGASNGVVVEPSTRRLTVAGAASAGADAASRTDAARSAASGWSFGMEPPLSSRDSCGLKGRRQVSWLPDSPGRAFPRRRGRPSGFVQLGLAGNSGGTAPDFHRTSLDHRPDYAPNCTP